MTVRVLHGPIEVAGVPQAMAEGLRRLGVQAESVAYDAHPYGFRSDVQLDLQRYSRLERHCRSLAFTARAARAYDVFHFHFGYSLLPWLLDLPLLRLAGKKVAVHFHGSDIRNREFVLHAGRAGAQAGMTSNRRPPVSTKAQQRVLNRWRRWANGISVSTPDLLSIASDAVHIPQPIDLRIWQFHPSPARRGGRLTILHLPSHRGMKGTECVVKAVAALRREGLDVDLTLAEQAGHKETKALYEQADVVVDQLLVGAYGLVTVEAMAVGRPVVCYIAENVRPLYGADPPVVSTGPTDLPEVLTRLLTDKPLRSRLSRDGRLYVEAHHEATAVARALLDFYSKC